MDMDVSGKLLYLVLHLLHHHECDRTVKVTLPSFSATSKVIVNNKR